ncbi:G3E family GTPase [Stella humosa]|uniref:G3E family GTPase n=1 Tax=Stella humosa TaxID=94 RepID=A0A3N1KZ25_9PROT|nr:GTP-binding protein [Stella humosa]ROP83900.1 G3E family GTPase [Stella humosa]BBK32838.1 GTP-binding protein [Stella humosa]
MAGTDFHILCGFLGSGKTTLLLDFLAGQDAADTAVLVNDVGRIDVDGAVVGRSSTGLPVAMLPNGCVCCSIGNELVASVETLVADRDDAGLPPFRRMILECSGLSRPGPIVRSLGDLGRHDFRVRVLATFDAGQGAAHAVHFEEAAAQLAAAQTIVLSKLDLDGAGPVEAAAAAARAINPFARLVAEPDRAARAAAAFTGHGPSAAVPPAPTVVGLRGLLHPRIAVFLATVPPGRPWEAIAHWIEDLAARCGDRLLRVKGLVAVAGVDGPVLVQGVGTIFSPPVRMPPGSGGDLGSVVVIAHDLSAVDLAATCAPHGVTIGQ